MATRGISFYPPGSRPEDDPIPTSMTANTQEQIEHLRASGWITLDQFLAERRECEKRQQEAAQKEAEKARVAAEKEQEAESERRKKAAADEKLRKEAEAEKRAVIAAKEARVNFIIQAALAQKRPHEERRVAINFQIIELKRGLRGNSSTEEHAVVVERLLQFDQELGTIRDRITAIDTQLAKDMEAAWA